MVEHFRVWTGLVLGIGQRLLVFFFLFFFVENDDRGKCLHTTG